MDAPILIQSCPTCGASIDISEEYPLATIACPVCGAEALVDGRMDRFELQEIVGRGGMGVVYKAYDEGLDRFVALKLLRLDKTTDEAIVQQMATEAAVTASINHPHVVRVFTTGTDRGRFYIVMELVDKGTLDQLILLQGRVAESQVLEVGMQIAQGLRAAQMAGLIHRDVKPGNILFADAHTAKIVDFGLAIFMEDEEKARGEVWGTPYYVAPEKLNNQPEDFRSDIYSLGGTLFHALAGRPPFEDEDASMVALKHLKSEVVSLQAFAPHVSNQTAYVINRTLAKDPNDRYQSYDELIEHLEFAAEQLRQNAAKPQPQRRVVMEDETSQQMMGWIVMAMVGLLVVGGIGAFVFRDQIFGPGAAKSTPVAAAPTTAAPAAKAEPLFRDALSKLASGDAQGALELYRKHLANPKYTAYQLAWANYGEATAALAAGKPDDARTAFRAVVNRAPYSGADEKTIDFLVDTARRLAGDRPIDPAEAKKLNPANYESLGVLLFALKEFNQGRLDKALPMFRQFRQTAPAGRDAWIGELKPLAQEFIQRCTEFQMGLDRFKDAKSPAEREAAVAALRNVKGPVEARIAELLKGAAPVAPVASSSGWTSAPLGMPGVQGRFSEAGGTFTITASGADIWGTSDSGHFVYRKLDGDGEIVARVASLEAVDPWSKAALMVRETAEANARNVCLLVSAGNGVSLQIRPTPGAPSTSVHTPGPKPPQWLKLVRRGDVLSGFHSVDGRQWTPAGEQTLPQLSKVVLMGLAVTSHRDDAATTATFEKVSFVPGR